MNCKNKTQSSNLISEIFAGTGLQVPTSLRTPQISHLYLYFDKVIEIFKALSSQNLCKWEYTCFEELVKDHGSIFVPPRPDIPTTSIEGSPYEFARSQLQQGLCYCEGFILLEGEMIPREHAWLIDKEFGTVFDPILGKNSVLYYGIPFTSSFVQQRFDEVGKAGIFQNDLLSTHSLLIHGLPENALYSID